VAGQAKAFHRFQVYASPGDRPLFAPFVRPVG